MALSGRLRLQHVGRETERRTVPPRQLLGTRREATSVDRVLMRRVVIDVRATSGP